MDTSNLNYYELRHLEWYYLTLAYDQFEKHDVLHWMYLFNSAQFRLLADDQGGKDVQSNSNYR
jgi:hypothetical protein